MTSASVRTAGHPAGMTAWLTPDLVLLDERCPLPLDLPFTPAQAERLGVSRGQMKRLLARGLVRRVLQGVYAAAQAPNDLVFRTLALHLVVSASAVVSDRTAAWLHGVDVLPRSAPTEAVPVSVHQRPGTRARRSGVQGGERMLRPGDVMEIGGLAVTTPLRTALDLGRMLWRFDALAALDQFLRLGVPRDSMLAELDRFKGYRGIIQLRAMIPIADPRAESVAESALRLHWYDACLPPPELQWWVYDDAGIGVYRLDLALPEALFAAEYDGEEHHSDDADRRDDEERRHWLDRRRGWLMEVFVNQDVYRLGADPGPRLRAGLVAARARLSPATSYPTLSSADVRAARRDRSASTGRPEVTGRRQAGSQN